MTVYNIHGTDTPVTTNAADATAYSMGTYFTPSVNGTVTHARWFSPTTANGSPVTAALFTTSNSTQVGSSTTFSGVVNGAWNTSAFGAGISVAAGVQYAIVVWISDRYVATSGYFSAGKTSGPLTVPVSGGRFTAGGTSPSFPTNSSGAASYFADVLFDDGVSTGVTPSGIAIPISLGQPSALNPARPTGISIPISLGQPGAGPTVPNPTPSTDNGRGWYGLLDIQEQNRQYAEDDAVPVACPNDGEPLDIDPQGRLRCHYDGWIYRP